MTPWLGTKQWVADWSTKQPPQTIIQVLHTTSANRKLQAKNKDRINAHTSSQGISMGYPYTTQGAGALRVTRKTITTSIYKQQLERISSQSSCTQQYDNILKQCPCNAECAINNTTATGRCRTLRCHCRLDCLASYTGTNGKYWR